MWQKTYKEIQQGNLLPIYLFYGTETFLMEEMVESIRKQMKLSKDSYGWVVHDLTEISIQETIIEAETLPFLSEKRLLIAKNAFFLTSKQVKNSVHHNINTLLQYIQQPSPTTTLVMIVPVDKLDKRKKVVKQLQKEIKTVECPPLRDQQLLQWLGRRFAQHQIQIDASVLKKMILLVGNDLRLLDQECRKIITFVGPGNQVTAEMLRSLVPRTLEQDVFKLIHCVVQRKKEAVFQIWYDLLYQKEEPIRIFALITRQLRLMLQTNILAKSGKTEKEMAAILQVHPYPVKLARQQGSTFTEQALVGYLSDAITTDQEIKSGKREKKIAIEQFLFRFLAS